MGKRIAIIDAHPDPRGERFCHALAGSYAAAAAAAGHGARRIVLAELDVPFLRSSEEWQNGPLPPSLQAAQEAIGWAEHLVIIYPLWLGSMPALLKAFLEHVFRPGFAIAAERRGPWPGLLQGKSARIVVTMGMPSLVYRLYFLAHSLKSFERNILRFSGIGPVRQTLIGRVDALGDEGRRKWLDRLGQFGQRGE